MTFPFEDDRTDRLSHPHPSCIETVDDLIDRIRALAGAGRTRVLYEPRYIRAVVLLERKHQPVVAIQRDLVTIAENAARIEILPGPREVRVELVFARGAR